MPPSIDAVRGWQGRTMVDAAGDELGTIDAAYLDDQTGQPGWATLTNGPRTAKAAFVPLGQAQDLGGRVRVPYDRQQVTDAPSLPAGGSLPQDQEAQPYRHHGPGDPGPAPTAACPPAPPGSRSTRATVTAAASTTRCTAARSAGTPPGRPPTRP